MTALCKHCGKPEDAHGHAFEAATMPEGCKCDPSEWYDADAIPVVCRAFVGPKSRVICEICEHLAECHEGGKRA